MLFNILEDLAGDLSNTSTRYDPENDKVNKFNIMDSRKNKLTLRDINKLKKMRTVRKIENMNRKKILGAMYITPTDD